LQLFERVGSRARAAVGANRCDRVERIDDREDPRLERNARSREAGRIAAAVPALVVEEHPRQRLFRHSDRAQHPRAGARMPPHLRPLDVVQRAGLDEHRLGHGELADVVEQRAETQAQKRPAIEPQPAGEAVGEHLDARRVTARERVACLDRAGEGSQRRHRTAIFNPGARFPAQVCWLIRSVSTGQFRRTRSRAARPWLGAASGASGFSVPPQ
jgi:hypothetical protein